MLCSSDFLEATFSQRSRSLSEFLLAPFQSSLSTQILSPDAPGGIIFPITPADSPVGLLHTCGFNDRLYVDYS